MTTVSNTSSLSSAQLVALMQQLAAERTAQSANENSDICDNNSGASASASLTSSDTTNAASTIYQLFQKIDSNGEGSSSQSKFENASNLPTVVSDALFSQMDTSGSGRITESEFAQAL